MAIDTREKRQSVVGIDRIAGPSPTPNASTDQEWRQEVGYGYPGILAGEPVTPSQPHDIGYKGGGRVLREDQYPEGWPPWEEPQPKVDPPKRRSTKADIAELAGTLKAPRKKEQKKEAPKQAKAVEKPKAPVVPIRKPEEQKAPQKPETPQKPDVSAEIERLKKDVKKLKRLALMLLHMALKK